MLSSIIEGAVLTLIGVALGAGLFYLLLLPDPCFYGGGC